MACVAVSTVVWSLSQGPFFSCLSTEFDSMIVTLSWLRGAGTQCCPTPHDPHARTPHAVDHVTRVGA